MFVIDGKAQGAAERQGGFSLVEVSVAMSVILLALMGLSGVLTSVARDREATVARTQVLFRAQSLMEELHGVPAMQVLSYNGNRYMVDGIDGNFSGGEALEIRVDDTTPELLEVRVLGSWLVRGSPHALELITKIHNPL